MLELGKLPLQNEEQQSIVCLIQQIGLYKELLSQVTYQNQLLSRDITYKQQNNLGQFGNMPGMNFMGGMNPMNIGNMNNLSSLGNNMGNGINSLGNMSSMSSQNLTNSQMHNLNNLQPMSGVPQSHLGSMLAHI
jgi:hypothetical protein